MAGSLGASTAGSGAAAGSGTDEGAPSRPGSRVMLYPLYHPAAALYTPSMLKVLEEDFARLPGLLGAPSSVPEPAAAPEPALEAPSEPAVQLGLF